MWNKSTVYLTHNWCVALISHFIWWVPHTSCVVQSLANWKDFCFRKRMIKRNAFAHNQRVKQRYHDMVWLIGEAFLCMKKSFLLMPTVMTYMEKISRIWLAESKSIYPKQCRRLKLSAENCNWVQKIKIECRKLKLSAAKVDDIHGKISRFWLAESKSIYLKQCGRLKLSADNWLSAKSWNEID